VKYRQPYSSKALGGQGTGRYTGVEAAGGRRRSLAKSEAANAEVLDSGLRVFRLDNMTSQRPPGDFPVEIVGRQIRPAKGHADTDNGTTLKAA